MIRTVLKLDILQRFEILVEDYGAVTHTLLASAATSDIENYLQS